MHHIARQVWMISRIQTENHTKEFDIFRVKKNEFLNNLLPVLGSRYQQDVFDMRNSTKNYVKSRFANYTGKFIM